ncbi:MAG: DUF4153 domain-containing protein [Bacteroidaceae bacterium]|nr:DUF4153 domain-containing protein [Bacteroidaceae bacterium]
MSSLKEKTIELFKAIRRSVERFPLTVVFAFALTVCMMILDWKGYHGISKEWKFFMIWYPASGIALSLSLSLWLEEHKGRWGYLLASALIHIAWIGVSVLLMRSYDMLGYAPYTYVVVALVATLVVSLLVLSFFSDKTDVAFWNFSLHCIGAVCIALIVSGIVCGGLELLVVGIEKLFGVFISSHCYSNIAIVCFCLLAPILLIQAVPGGAQKHDAQPMEMSRLIENAVTRLFMPIAAAYLVTLYCYAAKILFTWQLPDGWVSWLVTASMAAMVILFTMVYPYIEKASQSASGWNRMAVRFITWRMPILMLPLLLLMSIGITRRISDYGITVLRLYLVAFNIWCYAVCIVLIIKRNAGILWIPVSFILAFALLTLLPVNVSTCVRKNLTNKVTAILKDNGWDGKAMGDDEYDIFLNTLDSSVSHQLDSRIDYLKRQFSRQSVKDIVGSNVLTGRIPEHVFEDGKDGNVEIHRYRSVLGSTSFNLPANASRMLMYDEHVDLDKDCIKDEILTVQLPVISDKTDKNGDYLTLMYEFRIPLQQLRALENEMTPENIAKNDFNHIISYSGTLVNASSTDAPAKVILYLDTFHLRHDGKEGYFSVSGPLFFVD